MKVGVPDHAPEEHKQIARLINDGMQARELFRACFTFYQLELEQRLRDGTDLRVQSGLFRGMALFPQSLASQLLPKWLGTYELEVQHLLERHGQHCDAFLDIGCAEGFYLTGMAQWRGIPCAGVDIDPRSRQAVHDAACANKLQELITFQTSLDQAIGPLQGNLLCMVDVDGQELQVLSELQQQLEHHQGITDCRLIVESDLNSKGEHNTGEIVRFLSEHGWTVLGTTAQQPSLRFTGRHAERSLLDQVALAGEGRHGGQCWISAHRPSTPF